MFVYNNMETEFGFIIIIINSLYAEFICIAKKKKKGLRNIGRKFRNSAVDKQAQAVVIF